MKKYSYLKSNAFTAGESLGNPAACVFTGKDALSPQQMQAIAKEHKGFVMEMVFCGKSDVADCKLTYYSSECEVDFCGHGTIATMYSMINGWSYRPSSRRDRGCQSDRKRLFGKPLRASRHRRKMPMATAGIQYLAGECESGRSR